MAPAGVSGVGLSPPDRHPMIATRSPSGRRPGRHTGFGLVALLPAGNHPVAHRRPRASAMSDFSLNLSEDQQQIQKWVHDFAEEVVRPAAHEWDEREEFPWPIVEEAAKIGLYSFDFFAQASLGDSSGLTLPVALEELFWGDAGIGLSIFGSGLAAAGIAGTGTPEQVMEWVPQCFGTQDKIQLGAFCVSEPDAGSDVSSLKTRAVYDEATDEWVLNGTKAWATNGGIA